NPPLAVNPVRHIQSLPPQSAGVRHILPDAGSIELAPSLVFASVGGAPASALAMSVRTLASIACETLPSVPSSLSVEDPPPPPQAPKHAIKQLVLMNFRNISFLRLSHPMIDVLVRYCDRPFSDFHPTFHVLPPIGLMIANVSVTLQSG